MTTPQDRHALRKAIRQGVRQSQQPGGELEDMRPAPEDGSKENPLAVAIRLLQDAGGDEYHAAARELDQYVGDIRAALYHQHRTTAQPGQTLAQATDTRKGEHAIELLNRVCGKLSNHYGGDPAVTWENAPGLVEQLIEQVDAVYTDNQKLAADCAQLREASELQEAPTFDETEDALQQLRQLLSDFCGGWVTDPVAAVREQLEKFRESELRRADLHRQLSDLSELHGGQMGHEEPLIELTRILIKLEANQKPDGFEQHLQTILGELDRYRMALQSIGLQVQLANVQPLKGGA